MDKEKVTQYNFPLMDTPISYQITIHVNNMINTYGKGIIQEFKTELINSNQDGGTIIAGLIRHYGVQVFQEWFTLIYGWDFTKKAG